MTTCFHWGGPHRKSDGRPMLGKRYAYRVLWEEKHGPLARWEILHHRCLNSWCVNLAHLEVMRQGAHLVEHGLAGDWGQASKTQCPAGHPYDSENTYHYQRKDGRHERHCKQCTRDAKTRFRAKKYS